MKRAPNAENAEDANVNVNVGQAVVKDAPTTTASFNYHLPEIKSSEYKSVHVPAECMLRPRRHMNCRLNDSSTWFNRRLDALSTTITSVIGNPTVISSEPVCAVGRIVCDTNDAKLTCKTAVLECAKGPGGGQRVPLDFSKYTDSVSLFPGQLMAVEGVNQDGRKLVVSKILKAAIDKPTFAVSRPIKIAVSAMPLCTADSAENFEPLEKILEKTFDTCCDVLILFGPIMNAGHANVISGKGMTRTPIDNYNHVWSRLSLLTTNSHCTVLLVLGPNDLLMDPVYPPCPTTAIPSLPPRVHVVDYSNQVAVSGLSMWLSPLDVLMHLSGEEVGQNVQGDRLTRLFEHLLQQRTPYPLYPPHPSVPVDYQSLPLDCNSNNAAPDLIIAPSVLKHGVHVASNGSLLINPGRQQMVMVEVNPGGTPATSIAVRPIIITN